MPVAFEQVDHRGVERGQPLRRRRAGTQRRVAAQEPLLHVALVLVEQGDRDRRPVRVAPVERGPADAGGPGDVLHRHVVRAAAGEQAVRRGEDPGPVAGGVGAFHPPTVADVSSTSPPLKWT